MKFDSSSWYVKAGLLRFCGDHVRVFFFANYTFCTLGPEVPSQNKRCLQLILKALSPWHFEPRWRGFPAIISVDKKKVFSGTQDTHFVKSRAYSIRSTSKIISMIALRRARPCGERQCKSLVQRSRILMQKRPLLRFAGLEITLVWFSPLFTFHVLVAYGGPRGYI